MNSPSHRKNLLDQRWDRIGAGAAQQGDKKMYTVLFRITKPNAAAAGQPAIPAAGGDTTHASGATFEPRAAGRPVTPAPSLAPSAGAPTGPVEVAPVRTGLIDSMVNRLLRLFLNY
ncbi:MAG: hypothetical protein EXR51_01740 [Dehalococcoidia bacterium]|nr:hypothetical protein [Dehalococcoidia bacterium]